MTTEVKTEQSQVTQTPQDLVTRVSQKSEPEKKTDDLTQRVSQVQDNISEFKNFEQDIEKITDPYARKMLESHYKNMVKGMNDKFQQIADLRKDIESRKPESSQPTSWTKDRLRQALNDQTFASAVQEIMQESAPNGWTGSQEEWSVLNDNEKAQFRHLQNEIRSLRSSQNQFQLQQADEKLKQKYPDYDSQKILSFEQEISAKGVDDLWRRELIHKALNYEKSIQRAYELGLQDKNTSVQEKVNASSPDFSHASQTVQPGLERKEGETGLDYFKRIARERLQSTKMKT